MKYLFISSSLLCKSFSNGNFTMKLLGVFAGLLAFTACKSADVPVVTTEQGVVEGEVLLSRNGREYYSFLQLPYGKAGRFQAPTNPDKYEGILKANDMGEVCAQSMWITNEQSGIEDCLNLHVFSPKLNGNLPVMVFFHGGGFIVGSANLYHEKYFMDEDVVLVLVNYRLGPFGFLSTGDDVIPGNNGLKDQSQALQWVQANIAQFGGDPKSVTLFGESAGGSSVNYHMLSNMSKGLFHAGISQSGSVLNTWAFIPYPADMARKFGEAVNCPTKCSKGLLNCLLGKSTKEMLDAMPSFVEWGYDRLVPFGPVIEPELPGSFLTASPTELLQTGKFTRVPWIMGLNEDEGIMVHSAYILANAELSADLKENWERIFPITLAFNNDYYNFTKAAQTKMAQKIYDYYFGNKAIDLNSRQELTDLFSDRLFNHGVKKAMAIASDYTEVYPYLFTHNRGDFSYLQLLKIENSFGVTHGDELSFLFSDFNGEAPEFKKGSASEQVSKNLVKLWVSFARDKKPTALWGSEKEWKPIDASKSPAKTIQYYKLDSDTALVPEHFTKRLEFWEEILADASKQSKISADIKNEL